MTQGEILSSLAPIDTFVNICKQKRRIRISMSDVNLTMRFIDRAQKAAEKLSLFALNNFNSVDDNKRKLADLICGRFSTLMIDFNEIGTFDTQKNERYSADCFNNYLQSIIDILFNTIVACESLKDELPPPSKSKSIQKKTVDSNTKNEHVIDLVASEEEKDDNKETDVAPSSTETDGDEGVTKIVHIFDKRINENEVVKEMKKLRSDKVPGKRRWYVFYRVFRHIDWIGKAQNKFIDWVEQNFGWEDKKEFRGVQSEIINTPPDEWNNVIIVGKDGKEDNDEIGPNYYEFADTIVRAFVDVDCDGKIKDKDSFLVNQKLAGILHKKKWN